jgi:hypothetical protein
MSIAPCGVRAVARRDLKLSKRANPYLWENVCAGVREFSQNNGRHGPQRSILHHIDHVRRADLRLQTDQEAEQHLALVC